MATPLEGAAETTKAEPKKEMAEAVEEGLAEPEQTTEEWPEEELEEEGFLL